MRKVDFLSDSPKMYIFEKNSNKTTFGGFLTVIYLIILFLLAFAYIYSYDKNNKYIVTYTNYKKACDDTEREKNDRDSNYNPTLNFSFDIIDYSGQPLSKNYILLDERSGNIIERNKSNQFNISNLRIVVLYNCSDEECSLRNEDLEAYNKSVFYNFVFSRNFYEYDFEDSDKPIKLNKENYTTSYFQFSHDICNIFFNYWRLINVTDEPALSDTFIPKNKSFSGGDYYTSSGTIIKSNIINTATSKKLYNETFNFDGIYKILFVYYSRNLYTESIEYKRKKISVFDILANICSLALTIYNGFKFAFNFLYSENFHNYKIIEKILSKSNIPFKKDSSKIDDKDVDLSNISNKSPLLRELKNVDDTKKENVKENLKENEKDKTEKLIVVKDAINAPLPKFHFFHFICNIFSCLCFKNNKAQKCINNINEILEKYNSVDSIVYNQLMIELLFKDYKWNNPNLNSTKNIDLINKLNRNINGEI